MDRIAPTIRPVGKPRGYQTWTNLAFLHWRVPVGQLRDLIPAELEIDTFDGSAWVGLVPFYMSNVRPRRWPALPGLSWFCETNVRTYVHYRGSKPGVWFMSLDAQNRIAVWIARRFWNLNYFYSRMSLKTDFPNVSYSGHRSNGTGNYDLQIRLKDDCKNSRNAIPDSFEHFLAERYILYTLDRDRQLLHGQVHHASYPLVSAEVANCDQRLLAANDIDVCSMPESVLFSPGVDVEIFDLKPISND